MSDQTPLTSIIITTHERPELLPRAVASAFSAGTNVEVIVVDDASTDETSSVCRRLSGIDYLRVDSRQGVAGARNIGLLASRGEYVTFLDDDDLRLPQSIERQVRLLSADRQAGLIYGQATCLDEQGRPADSYPQNCPQGDLFWNLLEQNFIPCGSAIFRRSLLPQLGLLDDGAPGVDDWDWWIRIAELFPIIALPEPVIQWRRATPSSGQGSSAGASIVSASVKQYREYWSKLPRVTAAADNIRRAAWQRFSTNMAAHLCWETGRSLAYGKPGLALKNFFGLVSLGPLVCLRLARRYSRDRLQRLIRKTRTPDTPLGSEVERMH